MKDKEITRGLIQSGAISETTGFYFSRPQSSFQRVIEIKSGKSKYQLDGISMTIKTGSQDVHISVSDACKPSYTFTVSWVPTSVPAAKLKEILSSFCEVGRLTQDREDQSKYFVTTRTAVEKIPHWITSHTLVQSEACLLSANQSTPWSHLDKSQ